VQGATEAAAARGWRALQCHSCGAQLQVGEGLRTTQCPYCAAPAVVERPADPNRPEPTFVLGFVVTQEAAQATAKAWLRSTWFTPSAFQKADIHETRGIYLPAYLYTAEAYVDYTARIGENYTVTETYTDSQGKTRTRTKTKTEWRSLGGRWASYIDEIVVTASRGLPNDALQGVEPFDLRALRRMTPKILSGWIAEDPSMEPAHCRQQAHQEVVASVGERLGAHMPGDKHADLQYRTRLEREDLELVLLPVWVLAVRYHPDKPIVRLVINGQTKKLHGRPPRSWQKIVLTVLTVILVVAGAYVGLSLA
jgi:hypothetical protein